MMPYRFLWIFFIYAFLGWCAEVSYAALVTGKFINRGLPRLRSIDHNSALERLHRHMAHFRKH